MAHGAYTVSISSVDNDRALPKLRNRPNVRIPLRVISIVLAILTTALFASAIHYTNLSFTNLSGNGDWIDGLALAPSIIALIVSTVSLVGALATSSTRPIAVPSLGSVALDLPVWAIAIPALVYTIGGGMFWYWAPAVLDSAGQVDCSFPINAFARECGHVDAIGKLEMAGIAFLILLCLLHFGLWVDALTSVAKRRRNGTNGNKRPGFEMQVPKDMEHGSP